MKRCPYCGHVSSDTADICGSCGRTLLDTELDLAALQDALAHLARKSIAPVVLTLIEQLVEVAIGGTNPALVAINKVHFYRRVLAALRAKGITP